MKKAKVFANELIDFCYESPTPYHAVINAERLLIKNDFTQLFADEKWKIEKGKKYFCKKNDSAIIAFKAGTGSINKYGFRIAAAHTDSPCIKIKPNPGTIAENSFLKLNIEVYGGPIISTWLDRPLSIAGRVVTTSGSIMKPNVKFVNFNKPLCVIPNIAPHILPDIAKGYCYNKQNELQPIIGSVHARLSEQDFLLDIISKELEITNKDIIDFDLYLYEYGKGCFTGINEEFITSSRIDDLQAVHAGLHALIESGKSSSTAILACFDNEEVGSSTQQGADSQLLPEILERIVIATGGNREDYFRALANSFIASADGAHSVHPNFESKSDPTNRPIINDGLVIKLSANKSYTSDAFSAGIFEKICRTAKVGIQRFVNRSDMRGGSTIGPISSNHVSINSVDIGVPLLAMHGIRETCGVYDHYSMKKALKVLFKT